uniref:CSON013470 protein n=1 Tax=Culicoides sonorensis TaxID=179676 RepID=A0A336M857_CULSO
MEIIQKLNYDEMCQKYPKFNKIDVDIIQKWLEKSPHLPKITDYEIFCFLHAADFSIEIAKIKIDNFYTCRTHLKSYFDNRDPDTEEIEYIRDVVTHIPLPERTPEGYIIIYVNIFDTAKFNIKQYIKMLYL